MKFRTDGKLYEFDDTSLSFDEAELLEEYGLSIQEFSQALQQTKLRAIRAMVLIAKRRAGETVEWADLGSMDIVELSLSMVEENNIDITKAANGQNPEAVTALSAKLAERKKASVRKRA
jgi:hypothetical protein